MTKFPCRDIAFADIDMMSKFWPQDVGRRHIMKARKQTHDGVLTTVMKSYNFQVNFIVFNDFSRLFHTCYHFPDFSRPGKFQL